MLQSLLGSIIISLSPPLARPLLNYCPTPLLWMYYCTQLGEGAGVVLGKVGAAFGDFLPLKALSVFLAIGEEGLGKAVGLAVAGSTVASSSLVWSEVSKNGTCTDMHGLSVAPPSRLSAAFLLLVFDLHLGRALPPTVDIFLKVVRGAMTLGPDARRGRRSPWAGGSVCCSRPGPPPGTCVVSYYPPFTSSPTHSTCLT